MNMQLLGDTGNATPKYIELGGEAVEGSVLVEPFTPAESRPKVQNFQALPRAVQSRPDGWVAEMYDTVGIIHQAVEKAGKVDRQAIRDHAASFKPGKPYRGCSATGRTGERRSNLSALQGPGEERPEGASWRGEALLLARPRATVMRGAGPR